MNLLAGDLGGTKTILAIYSYESRPRKIHHKVYVSKDWSSFDLILKNYIKEIPKNIDYPEYGCIAIAGQVTGKLSKITNLGWNIDADKLAKIADLNQIELINDFSALIYGVPNFDKSQYLEIQGQVQQKLNPSESIAIIGAGTGLGIARGVKNKKGIKPFPSEGGHREFSARSEQEWKFSQWLKSIS